MGRRLLVSTLLHDLRFGVRLLVKQPGFALITTLTLALGIGANTAIFGIVNAVLLKPLPYQEPDRVVMLWSHWINWKRTWVSEPELADYQHQARSLEHVAGFTTASFNLTGGGEPERIRAMQVQADMFAALGARPLLGRVFTADEDRPGHDHVALISEGLWRVRFGSSPSIVGGAIELDGTPYTVLGVLPASLRLPTEYATRSTAQVWVPLALGPPDPNDRGNHGLNALGRLKPGATLSQGQAEIDTMTRGFQQTFANTYDPEFGLTLVPATAEVYGEIEPALLALVGAVGAVLLIACANVANLLLARSDARQKEIAIRAALGAGRSRLVSQLMAESVVLSLLGGSAGIALAWLLTHSLIAADPLRIPRVADVTIDARVLAFTTLLSLATGVLFGLTPALHAAGSSLQPVLKEGGRDARVTSGWLRRVLVVAQIAASVALVAAAMLLARSFARLQQVNAGFSAAHVLTLRTSLPPTRYRDGAATSSAFRDIALRLREIPSVQAAGGVSGLPLASTRGDWGIVIEGRPVDSQRSLAADWQVVTPGYFAAMGIPIKSGRAFTDADTADAPGVILINETMARTFWPGEDPIGRRMRMGGGGPLTVIGIVGDVRHLGLDHEARTEMYRPVAQFRFGSRPNAEGISSLTWAVRVDGDPTAATAFAREAIRRVDPGLGLSDVATMERVVSDSTSDRRLGLALFALLGGLALTLAAIGVYGVVAYSVAQRTHEIGVRMAIGARPFDVRRMVLSEGFRLAAIGVLVGSGLAVVGARAIRGLLFQVSATDPLTFASVAIALLAVAAAASYVPARRATRVDPIVALRGE